jgi:glycosyltransferase involved in cell wall biosynthesis
LFEALASGLPIVCSNRVGNAVDLIREGANGFTVDPSDIDRTAEKIAKALTSLERRVAGQVSRELVAKATYDNAARVFVDAAVPASEIPVSRPPSAPSCHGNPVRDAGC